MAERCAACHKDIPAGQQRYTLRVDLFASVDEEIEITDEDLERDTRAEILRLAARLADMDPDEAEEEARRIFERRIYTLCAVCRAEVVDLLRGRDTPVLAH